MAEFLSIPILLRLNINLDIGKLAVLRLYLCLPNAQSALPRSSFWANLQ